MERTEIRVISRETRSAWTSLADFKKAGFSEADIFAMCQRYQDSQHHAKAYRERAKVKGQLMKERLAELEAKLAQVETEEVEG